jgi:hypothetical protein
MPNTTILSGRHGTFAVVENWSSQLLTVEPARFGAAFRGLGPFVLPPRDARIVAAGVDLAFVDGGYRAGDTLSTSCAYAGRDKRAPVFTAGYPSPLDSLAKPPVPRCEIVAKLRGTVRRTVLDDRATAAPGARPHTVFRSVSIDLAEMALPLVGVPLAPGSTFVPAGAAARVPEKTGPVAERVDVFEDGASEVVLRNDRVRAIVVPNGGARLVLFGPTQTRPGREDVSANAFDATGALRDDVLIQPPPSPTDRIAKYTHTYPAGMFNRLYSACTFATASGPATARTAGAYLAYDAPDVVPAGALFERIVSLGAAADRLIADERLTPRGAAGAQRLVSYSAIPLGDSLEDGAGSHPANQPVTLDPRGGGVSFRRGARPGPVLHSEAARTLSVAWPPDAVESASWTPARSNGTLRLVLARGGWRRLTFARFDAGSDAEAAAFVQAERRWVAANRHVPADDPPAQCATGRSPAR